MNMKFISLTLISAYCVSIGLTGCARYQVTLNEQPIYTPPPLYTDFKVTDPALDGCLRQTIVDQNIVRPEQLKKLTCRHAGIRSVQGLEHFTALQELDLSHNLLQDFNALTKLKSLQHLKLNDNPQLSCDQLTKLAQASLEVIPPIHCSG